MKLAIIIPCLNEEQTLAEVLQRLPQRLGGIAEIQTIVVDDGSDDRTVEIAKSHGVTVLSHGANMGVGAAFQSGLLTAIRWGADVVVNMDGDGQFNPSDIAELIKPIVEAQADLVTASRFKKAELEPEMPFVKKWGNRRMADLISFLTGRRFYDVSCGFRAYSQEAALQLNLFGQFTYTQESLMDLAFKGLRIMEVPLQVRGVREFGESRIASSVVRYALRTSKIIVLAYRDYKPLAFFGFIAAGFLLLALGTGGFFFWHYLTQGRFSPHLWAGFTAGFSFITSILFFALGLLADMVGRVRSAQERILYLDKCRLIRGGK